MGKLRKQVLSVYNCVLEFEETLGSGTLPTDEKWASLGALPSPWGVLVSESLSQLRASGGALLPTLRRLRSLAFEQSKVLAEAQARSSQALGQAVGGVFFVVLFGVVLYEILPGVSDSPVIWWSLCGLALVSASLGALWILSLAERARWAGLPKNSQNWILATQCAGERFLAMVRAGNPADIAWAQACEFLAQDAPALAFAWGHSIWKSPPVSLNASGRVSCSLNLAETILAGAGESIRKAVQISLMEGRPCAERVESVLSSVHHDIRARIDTELSLLSTRALKPLFIFVAPGIFVLLGAGLYLCFENVIG